MPRRVFFVLISVLSFYGQLYAQLDRAAPPSTANPLTRDTARVEAGSILFREHCTGCHGRSGEGGQGEGQGPNLAMSWEVRRAKDQDLFNFIRNGVKGTAMPAFPLPEEQIWQLAAFIRSLNAPASSVPVPGNVSSGEATFFAKGQCSTCHMIKGRGGYLGPDLSNIGATRRLGELRSALVSPSSEPSPDYLPLLITDDRGHRLRAVAKHRSPWSVQVLDERGKLHLVHGNEVKRLTFLDRSWMPTDYSQKLSSEDIQNLLAFLSRQVIRPQTVAFSEGDNK